MFPLDLYFCLLEIYELIKDINYNVYTIKNKKLNLKLRLFKLPFDVLYKQDIWFLHSQYKY